MLDEHMQSFHAVFMRCFVTHLVPRCALRGAIFVASSGPDQCLPEQASALHD
jgi:hypothetical protein